MLQEIINYILYGLFNLNRSSKLIESLNFFIYDSIKIIVMLLLLVSILGFIRSYLPIAKLKKYLSKKHSYFLASIFGALTPFCSCSSLPIFISFINAGVPIGPTFSFLVTSPIVNEYLVVLMLGFFGWKITVAYVLAGILIGVISGMILNRLNVEKYIIRDIKSNVDSQEKFKTIKSRIFFGISESLQILKKLWYWILFGVGLGALIHNFVPQNLVESIKGPFAVPLAVLIGVPIYGSCSAIVPIALALFQKGLALGTALSFMMAVSALSLPQLIILRRTMKIELLGLFYGFVTLSIIIVGYLLNFLQGIF
ncbi:permease [Candidatus Woesearchaeota archaeon]|nr:permease [Candidatus Woesearchaeota archaeon]